MMVHEEAAVEPAGDFSDQSPQALREALQNLRVHQIELEMQNDELRRIQAALNTADARYFDFYDLAPVGYITVSEKAVILQANLTTASLLGVPRANLIGKALPGFMPAPDADRFYLLSQQTQTSGSAQSCELRLRKSAGDTFWVKLQAIAATNDEGAAVIRMVLSDITQRRQLEQSAKEASEEKFKLVADNTSDGIVIFDGNRHIEYVSPAYVKQLGYSEAEELGLTQDMIYARVHPQDRDAMFASIESAIESKQTELLFSYRVEHRLGHYIWREDSAKLLYDGSGKAAGACVISRDITQRRQTEEALELERNKLVAAFSNLTIGLTMCDAQGGNITMNPAALKFHGFSSEQDMGRRLADYASDWELRYLDGRTMPFDEWPLARTLRGFCVSNFDTVLHKVKTGFEIVCSYTSAQVRNSTGEVVLVVMTTVDISERIRAETAMQEMNRGLAQSRQELRQWVALNESSLENEKRHIAREVHDELGQILTALRMNITLATVRHAGPVPELLDALNGMKTQVDRAIQGVRNVASSLRPPELDLGLVTSVEWLCNEFSRHAGVACELKAAHEAIECDASRAVVVFRIVQESLTNISKYAQASQVVVSLVPSANELWVEVRDNGLGFNPATVTRSGSLGLLGMRERAIALGGRFEVNSKPGQGTVIDLVIPLDPDGLGGAA